MDIVISFPFNSFQTCADALTFIYPFINIDIIAIWSGKSFSGGYNAFEWEDAIEKLKKNDDVFFSLSSEFNNFHEEKNSIMFRKDKNKAAALFFLKLEEEVNIQLEELLIASVKLDFALAYKCDLLKSRWQSEEIIANYEHYKRPYDHLKKIVDPKLPPIIGRKIDISENPGHQKLTYTMNLMAAPEMWFGPGAWKYFDKDLITSFPELKGMRFVSDDIIYIKLFDWNIPDYEAPEILDLQRKFRVWTRMDDIEKELDHQLKNIHRK